MQEKKGIIADIIFHNEKNGYTIAVFETEEEQFTAVGSIAACRKGLSLILRGKFTVHPTYGEQFAFSEYEEVIPESVQGIEEFLATGALKGIGKKTAAAIVHKFGKDTLRIMEEEPERLAEVSGIGEKKAAAIGEAFALHREFARVTMYFQKYGISPDYSLKLYKAYGSQTITIIEENPYVMIDDIFGIGFRKADAIAAKIGISPEDPARVKSGIKYAMWYYIGEGNTYCPQKELCEKTAQLLDISSSVIYDYLTEMAFAGDIVMESSEGRVNVYITSYYMAEQNVTKSLMAINTASLKPVDSDIRSLIEFTENETGIRLSDNQKYAVETSLQNGVSVITGGPGTGKTTIINTIINVLNQSGLSTAIAAPTGRAAKRITETSGSDAVTIHRLLEYYYSEAEDTMRFGKDAGNPLDYDAVIIDEASMIDLMLMNGLVSAIKPGTRLIIVGDADQLPSVGAGNVLRDIIESEYIYCIKLTEIFRQAKESLIVVNAHRINKGEYPDYNEKGKEFFLMRQKTEKEMLALIKDLCARRLPNYYTSLNPLKDIQVLTPVRKGTLGTMNLNRQLQEILNPPAADIEEKTFGERTFREGDKVMQIKNNYQLKWKNTDDFTEGEGAFNGDVGFVQSIDKEYGKITVLFDDRRAASYDFSQLDELELAYAVTVHKSQGSEFPVIVMPVSWFPPMLATRNLLYTAVTRGKEAVVLVGSEDKLNAMIDNNRIAARYSGLAAKLAKLMKTEIL